VWISLLLFFFFFSNKEDPTEEEKNLITKMIYRYVIQLKRIGKNSLNLLNSYKIYIWRAFLRGLYWEENPFVSFCY
jgi:hypothetical protein